VGLLRMRNVRRFKSKRAYRKWLAYGHMRTKTGKLAKSPRKSIFATTPGHQKVYIRGKLHKVKH
jgi:hypothetical protein